MAVCIAQLRPLIRKVAPKSWQTSANAGHQPNSPNAPNDPDHPPTFGAGDRRPERRSFGRSLLESTFGRSRSRTTPGAVETVEIDPVRNRDGNLGSDDGFNIEKKRPVHNEYV